MDRHTLLEQRRGGRVPRIVDPGIEDLQRQRQRAEELGATVLYDRTDDDGEPLYVLAGLGRPSFGASLHPRARAEGYWLGCHGLCTRCSCQMATGRLICG